MPRLRFPGFEGEWGWELGSELLRIVNDKPYQIQASEYHDHGRFEVVDQGKNAIVGYSDMEEKLFTSIPIIVFGDHTTTVKYRDRPFIVGGDGVKLLASCSDKISLKYLFYALLRYGPKVEGYKRHYTMLKEKSIPIPLKNEQEGLAYLLSLIDYRITAQRKLVELLKKHKKGLHSVIFGQKCRVVNADGKPWPAWRQVRIGDIFQERSERGGTADELLSVTINNGVKRQADTDKKDSSSEDKSNYKKVLPGDIVYNTMRMWQGASGVSPWAGIVSPAYTVIYPLGRQNTTFWAYAFKYWRLIQEFQKFSQGLTSDTWNLKYPQLSDIHVYEPSIDE